MERVFREPLETTINSPCGLGITTLSSICSRSKPTAVLSVLLIRSKNSFASTGKRGGGPIGSQQNGHCLRAGQNLSPGCRQLCSNRSTFGGVRQPGHFG